MGIKITESLLLPLSDIEFIPIRAQGPGGQHVNKVSVAIHLRFNIKGSSLPDALKTRLCHLRDYRINADGIVVIKAQRYRSQESNKEDALERLVALIQKVSTQPKRRIKTRPSRGSVKNRLEEKKQRGHLKKMRQMTAE